MGTGRGEVMRNGGGELVAACNQFQRLRGEKSTRLGIVPHDLFGGDTDQACLCQSAAGNGVIAL